MYGIYKEIERLKRKCKCSKIRVVNIEATTPDTERRNTIQVLSNDEIWFVACDGEAVLLGLTEGVQTCTDVLTCLGIDPEGSGDGGTVINELGEFIPLVSEDAGNDLSIGADGGTFYQTPVLVEHFGINIDEGAVVSTGYKGRLIVPYAGTITGWTILETSEVPITGSIVVDVLRGTYADYDATPIFVSIAGTEKPTISANVKGQDLALSTWTTAVAAGDILQFSVDSAATVEKIYVSILIQRT